MTRTALCLLALSVVPLILATVSCAATEVKLTVAETAGVARTVEPVRTGVPFAKGAVEDLAVLRLFDAKGVSLPLDAHLLSPWPDGSVRTALITFLADVPANGTAAFTLKDSGPKPKIPPTAPLWLRVRDQADAVTLSGPAIELTVSKKRSSLIESLRLFGGKPLIEPGGPGAILIT